MNSMGRLAGLLTLSVLLVCSAFGDTVPMSPVVISLDTVVYTGSPDASPPVLDWGNANHYITATLVQLGANAVQLTMDITNLADSESVAAWFFELTAIPGNLAFTWQSGAHAVGVAWGNNSYDPPGEGRFDIRFNYGIYPIATPPYYRGGWLRTANTTSVYTITGTGLSIDDFLDPGTRWDSAANLWCHPTTIAGTGSVVPEPGSILLLGTCLAACLGALRRKLRTQR